MLLQCRRCSRWRVRGGGPTSRVSGTVFGAAIPCLLLLVLLAEGWVVTASTFPTAFHITLFGLVLRALIHPEIADVEVLIKRLLHTRIALFKVTCILVLAAFQIILVILPQVRNSKFTACSRKRGRGDTPKGRI